MSVETTTQRLAAMGALISGIRTSFENIPRVVQDAELPVFIVVPGEATYDLTSDGEEIVREVRTYLLYVLVENMQLGSENQAQIAIAPYFSRVRNYFVARPGLELDTNAEPQDVVYDAALVGDRGFQAIPYPGMQNSPVYAGIEFRLQVTELANISYQD